MILNHLVHPFTSDRSQVPAWHLKVDRWYQLDGAAYGLVDAYFSCLPKLLCRPDFIFLASPSASNQTDFEFVESGAISPSLFVHTLPNIRSAPLLQAMEWAGPLLCLQMGCQTLISACVEAAQMALNSQQNVWILSVFQNRKDLQNEIHIFEILAPKTSARLRVKHEVILSDQRAGLLSEIVDDDLLNWLEEKTRHSEFKISASMKIKRGT